MRKIVLDKVVIGTRLDALIYAFLNDLPLLLADIKKPSQVEYLEETSLPVIGDFPSTQLKTATVVKTVGPNKLEVWNRLSFLLSIRGKIPFADKISFIRVDEEKKELKIVTHNSRSIIIHCNRVVIFDDKNVNGLPAAVKTCGDDTKRTVLDWIDVRSGMVHPYDVIEAELPFVNSVHFYPSNRIDGNHDRKDLVAVSYLTRDQLNNINYSDLLVRYRVLEMMKEVGIRGRRNGKDSNNPAKYKHYAIKLEMNKREVDLEEKNLYNNTSFIKFKYDTAEELLKNAATVSSPLFELYSSLKGAPP